MTGEMPHILVVDDDTRLRELLRKFLSENGFRVTTSNDAAHARAKLNGLTFDLIVLDLMMPGESGLDLARKLRQRDAGTPILMLTALGEPEDRITGLERGADDYLTKPFEPRELLLRLRNLLRRVPPPPETPTDIHLGELRFNLAREMLYRGNDTVSLTTAEARLLKALASRPGVALSREQLTETSGIQAGARAIDVHVTRIRRKIEDDPRTPRYLQTVRGKGYALWPD